MNENKKFSISNMMLAFITVLVVIGLVALTGFFLLTPPDDIIMGQAEANQVRISGKVPGRIEMYRFDEGDKVKAGDTLVYLNTPEVLAKLQQAEAVQKAAEAQNAKALKGARAQEIAGAYEMWQKAQARLTAPSYMPDMMPSPTQKKRCITCAGMQCMKTCARVWMCTFSAMVRWCFVLTRRTGTSWRNSNSAAKPTAYKACSC